MSVCDWSRSAESRKINRDTSVTRVTDEPQRRTIRALISTAELPTDLIADQTNTNGQIVPKPEQHKCIALTEHRRLLIAATLLHETEFLLEMLRMLTCREMSKNSVTVV